MLVAQRATQVPLRQRVEAHVDVAGHAVAAGAGGFVRRNAVGNLRPRCRTVAWRSAVAAVGPRGPVTVAHLVGVTAVLQAPGQVKRLVQADVEAALQVQVAGQLCGDPGARFEMVGRGLAQRGVLVVRGALQRRVAPVGAGQVPGPLAGIALGAEGALHIIFLDVPGGRVATGVAVGAGGDGVGDGRQAEVLALLGLAVRIGGEGVQGQVVA
ncbi:hypothetical protein D3C76_929350 [compost metagenome]